MARTDIILMSDYTPEIANGDLVIGASDDQHIELLMMTTPGQWKESPLVGIGLINYLKKPTTSEKQMKRDIIVGLSADGYKVNELSLDNGSFDLDYELNE